MDYGSQAKTGKGGKGSKATKKSKTAKSKGRRHPRGGSKKATGSAGQKKAAAGHSSVHHPPGVPSFLQDFPQEDAPTESQEEETLEKELIKETPHKETPHQGTPHQGTPHQGTPHQGTPHHGTPHKETPHKEAAAGGSKPTGPPPRVTTEPFERGPCICCPCVKIRVVWWVFLLTIGAIVLYIPGICYGFYIIILDDVRRYKAWIGFQHPVCDTRGACVNFLASFNIHNPKSLEYTFKTYVVLAVIMIFIHILLIFPIVCNQVTAFVCFIHPSVLTIVMILAIAAVVLFQFSPVSGIYIEGIAPVWFINGLYEIWLTVCWICFFKHIKRRGGVGGLRRKAVVTPFNPNNPHAHRTHKPEGEEAPKAHGGAHQGVHHHHGSAHQITSPHEHHSTPHRPDQPTSAAPAAPHTHHAHGAHGPHHAGGHGGPHHQGPHHHGERALSTTIYDALKPADHAKTEDDDEEGRRPSGVGIDLDTVLKDEELLDSDKVKDEQGGSISQDGLSSRETTKSLGKLEPKGLGLASTVNVEMTAEEKKLMNMITERSKKKRKMVVHRRKVHHSHRRAAGTVGKKKSQGHRKHDKRK